VEKERREEEKEDIIMEDGKEEILDGVERLLSLEEEEIVGDVDVDHVDADLFDRFQILDLSKKIG
jgi:hypothetical protein